MQTFRTFATEQEARTYRHEHGTGGCIFVEEEPCKRVVLFPPEMCPVEIFHHGMTRGLTGKLISNG